MHTLLPMCHLLSRILPQKQTQPQTPISSICGEQIPLGTLNTSYSERDTKILLVGYSPKGDAKSDIAGECKVVWRFWCVFIIVIMVRSCIKVWISIEFKPKNIPVGARGHMLVSCCMPFHSIDSSVTNQDISFALVQLVPFLYILLFFSALLGSPLLFYQHIILSSITGYSAFYWSRDAHSHNKAT